MKEVEHDLGPFLDIATRLSAGHRRIGKQHVFQCGNFIEQLAAPEQLQRWPESIAIDVGQENLIHRIRLLWGSTEGDERHRRALERFPVPQPYGCGARR